MRAWQLQLLERPLLLGLRIGLLLGCLNLLHTWIWSLGMTRQGRSSGYGPTFFVWAYASFQEARRRTGGSGAS